jgi:REP element-mobilizing transposase RayT
MRTARIKISPVEGESFYHCMSRTVNGERLFDDSAKEILRKQIHQTADYCGVQILTYAILSNHFHVLLRVPQAAELSDAELLRRYRVMYPKPTVYQVARLEVIESHLKSGAPEGEAWRKRQLALMGDVSQFMKLVKQRFSIWYNKSHKRYGTLWSERFKSVLVEGNGRVLETMAAYIDLNSVRAGLVDDPKDYRFCGYAEAVAGGNEARAGIKRIVGESADWADTQAAYRETLFGKGSADKEHARALSPEQLAQVLKSRGKLPLATVLRCRLRYFSDGAVLGGRAFVSKHLADYGRRYGRRRNKSPRQLPALTDWGGELSTLRGLKNV